MKKNVREGSQRPRTQQKNTQHKNTRQKNITSRGRTAGPPPSDDIPPIFESGGWMDGVCLVNVTRRSHTSRSLWATLLVTLVLLAGMACLVTESSGLVREVAYWVLGLSGAALVLQYDSLFVSSHLLVSMGDGQVTGLRLAGTDDWLAPTALKEVSFRFDEFNSEGRTFYVATYELGLGSFEFRLADLHTKLMPWSLMDPSGRLYADLQKKPGPALQPRPDHRARFLSDLLLGPFLRLAKEFRTRPVLAVYRCCFSPGCSFGTWLKCPSKPCSTGTILESLKNTWIVCPRGPMRC